MPELESTKPQIDWHLVVTLLMIGLAFAFGVLTEAWLLPWLRGNI
jgi:hypothetical protein